MTAPDRERPAAIAFDALPPGTWTGSARIRFSHCDPAGIVYFARYFEIVHGVIEDWMEDALGLSHAVLTATRRIGLGYAHAEADYFTPGFDGDRLQAAVILGRVGKSSIGLTVPVYRDRTPLLSARLVMVTTSLIDHTVIPIPDDLRNALMRYGENQTIV